MDRVRELIEAKVKEMNLDLSSLSLSMGRNHAYLQQFLRRGVPAELKERDRERLAPLLHVKPDILRLEPKEGSAGTGLTSMARPNVFVSYARSDAAYAAQAMSFYEDVGWRLRIATEAVGASPDEVAKVMRVPVGQLETWFRDAKTLDWFALARFCWRYAVSADWVLLGEVGTLRKNLADSLAPALEERSAALAEAGRHSPEKTS